MTPLRSILVLATVVCSVLVPYFIGHGLALHETRPILYAGILLIAAVVFGFLCARGIGERADEVEHGAPH